MPDREQQLERLISLLGRLLDRGLLEEHEQTVTDARQLRNDFGHADERLKKLEAISEESANNYLEDLKKKLKSHEESDNYWVRYVVAAFVSVLFMAISAGLGYIARGTH